MPELAGRVADAFEARIRAPEESALSPLAVRSYETRGRAPRGGGVRHPDALPARPRPDRPLEAVPPAEGQDAGLHRPRRRPLPHADDAHARDDRDRARRRPRAAAERGPDRGDRARARHGPSAVRARRRGAARPLPARAVRQRLPPQRAVAADRRGAEPHRRGARRDPHAHRRRRSRRRSRARSSGSSTASRTSTTTSTTRSATGCSRPTTCRGPRSTCSGETGSSRIDTLVHDLIESSERAGDIVQSEEVGAAMLALRAFMFERVYLGEHARGEHERAHATITRDLRPPRRARRLRGRDPRRSSPG